MNVWAEYAHAEQAEQLVRVRLARALDELAKAEEAALDYASWFRPGAERRTGGDADAVIDAPEYGAALDRCGPLATAREALQKVADLWAPTVLPGDTTAKGGER